MKFILGALFYEIEAMDSNFSHFVGHNVGFCGIFVRKLSELGLNSVSIVETRIIVAIIIIIAGLLCLDKNYSKSN